MTKFYLKFNVTPRVLCADETQTVSVSGRDSSCCFYDDTEYLVSITASDCWQFVEGKVLKEMDCVKEYRLHPSKGVLSFEHHFYGEHEWQVRIEQIDETHVPEHIKKFHPSKVPSCKLETEFKLYSVEKDLYKLRPFKGDLHIHTSGSDGVMSPELTAAQYRRYGFDYICITDHHRIEPSLEAVEYYNKIKTALKIFSGEEVHPCGNLHMVNFNPQYSVCALARENPERTEQEVNELVKLFCDADPDTAYVLAWYKWVCDNIRKAGGVAIYPHPLWRPRGRVNIRLDTTKEILKRGICDVFEIYGGTDRNNNRTQVQLSYQLASEGHKLPIVGSSDSHGCLSHNYSRFNQAWTITFAPASDGIPEAVRHGNSVVVDNYLPSDRNIYGEFRLVQYTWFLLENYFEMHDELCSAVGQAIIRYVQGDDSQNEIIYALEKEVLKFTDEFFGKI